MSQQLSAAAVTKFEAEVHHQFQHDIQSLDKFVRIKDAAGAKTVKFPVMGKGVAQKREGVHTEIPVMNVSHAPITVTMEDYTASELTDIFKDAQTNINERTELVKTVSMALNRRSLQLVLDALAAAVTGGLITKTVAKNVSGTDDNLNLEMLSAAVKKINVDGGKGMDKTLICHTYGLHHLILEDKVASSDYNTMRVLNEGKLDSYYGFNFLELGDMEEGGLPLSTADRTNYAFNKIAVGLAINLKPTIKVDWSPDYGAWRTTGFLSANACVVDPTGVVKITSLE
jgi:hypothetical protein